MHKKKVSSSPIHNSFPSRSRPLEPKTGLATFFGIGTEEIRKSIEALDRILDRYDADGNNHDTSYGAEVNRQCSLQSDERLAQMSATSMMTSETTHRLRKSIACPGVGEDDFPLPPSLAQRHSSCTGGFLQDFQFAAKTGQRCPPPSVPKRRPDTKLSSSSSLSSTESTLLPATQYVSNGSCESFGSNSGEKKRYPESGYITPDQETVDSVFSFIHDRSVSTRMFIPERGEDGVQATSTMLAIGKFTDGIGHQDGMGNSQRLYQSDSAFPVPPAEFRDSQKTNSENVMASCSQPVQRSDDMPIPCAVPPPPIVDMMPYAIPSPPVNPGMINIASSIVQSNIQPCAVPPPPLIANIVSYTVPPPPPMATVVPYTVPPPPPITSILLSQSVVYPPSVNGNIISDSSTAIPSSTSNLFSHSMSMTAGTKQLPSATPAGGPAVTASTSGVLEAPVLPPPPVGLINPSSSSNSLSKQPPPPTMPKSAKKQPEPLPAPEGSATDRSALPFKVNLKPIQTNITRSESTAATADTEIESLSARISAIVSVCGGEVGISSPPPSDIPGPNRKSVPIKSDSQHRLSMTLSQALPNPPALSLSTQVVSDVDDFPPPPSFLTGSSGGVPSPTMSKSYIGQTAVTGTIDAAKDRSQMPASTILQRNHSSESASSAVKDPTSVVISPSMDLEDFPPPTDWIIDVTKMVGYQEIPPNCPVWKRSLIEKKNKQLEEEAMKIHQSKLENEKRWRHVPEWKRSLIVEKEKKKQDESAPQYAEHRRMEEEKERLQNLPEWKRSLLTKKRSDVP